MKFEVGTISPKFYLGTISPDFSGEIVPPAFWGRILQGTSSPAFHKQSTTLLHYGSLPFTSVVGSESKPSSRGIFVT